MSTAPGSSRRPRRWRGILIGVGATVVAGFLFWLGLGTAQTAMLWVSLLLLAAFLPLSEVPTLMRFPRLPYARRDGTRREVSTLSWALYGEGSLLRPPALRRLHSAGIRACRHAGIDPADAVGRARAREVLGEETLAFLDDPEAEPVDVRRMRQHLTAFERLDLRKEML